jgi:Fe2+ or Zn2+ uptake regulation protein
MTVKAQTRETQQRRIVYETIRNTRTHPTADWIFDRVRSRMPKISLGTVYRNLSVLKREGLVREIFGTDRRARYEDNQQPHAHFICTSCGEIRDVDVTPESEWQALKDLVGCEVYEQRMEFLGRCPACVHRKRGAF